jgi:hypothetical protein
MRQYEHTTFARKSLVGIWIDELKGSSTQTFPNHTTSKACKPCKSSDRIYKSRETTILAIEINSSLLPEFVPSLEMDNQHRKHFTKDYLSLLISTRISSALTPGSSTTTMYANLDSATSMRGIHLESENNNKNKIWSKNCLQSSFSGQASKQKKPPWKNTSRSTDYLCFHFLQFLIQAWVEHFEQTRAHLKTILSLACSLLVYQTEVFPHDRTLLFYAELVEKWMIPQ